MTRLLPLKALFAVNYAAVYGLGLYNAAFGQGRTRRAPETMDYMELGLRVCAVHIYAGVQSKDD